MLGLAAVAAAMLAGATASMAAPACARGQMESGGFSVESSARNPVAEALSWSAPIRSAVILSDDGSPSHGDRDRRSLWVSAPRPDRLCYGKLLSSRTSNDPKQNLGGMDHPAFSPDGGFIYVLTDAWATSAAVHEVNIATGAERFVIDANSLSVVRTGPYRGMLLVSRHKYTQAPDSHAYDPVDLVRPDGSVVLTVPGSGADEGETSVPRWLKAHGGKVY